MAAVLNGPRDAVRAATADLTTALAAAAGEVNNAVLRTAAVNALATADAALAAFRGVDLSAEADPPAAVAARAAEANALQAPIDARRATLAALPPLALGPILANAALAVRAAAGPAPLPFNARVAALRAVAALIPGLGAHVVPGQSNASRNARIALGNQVGQQAVAALNAAVAQQAANAAALAANLPTRKSAAMTARIQAIGDRFAVCVGALADEVAFKTALEQLAISLEAIGTLVGRLDENAAAFGVNVANAARANAAAAAAATPAARAAAAAAPPPRRSLLNRLRGRPARGGGRKALKSMKKRKTVKKSKKTRKNRK